MKNGQTKKTLTPKRLNAFFEQIAIENNENEKRLFVENMASLKQDNPEMFRKDYAVFAESLKDWKTKIKAGGLLRILKHVKAFNGKTIDAKRLETALLTANFILSCSCDLNGRLFYFEHCTTEFCLHDIQRCLHYVRRNRTGLQMQDIGTFEH